MKVDLNKHSEFIEAAIDALKAISKMSVEAEDNCTSAILVDSVWSIADALENEILPSEDDDESEGDAK